MDRKWWIALTALPYIVGVVWICLHPLLSVVTGELKCRGLYIDEHSLDSSYFRLEASYSSASYTSPQLDSLCKAVQHKYGNDNNNNNNIVCHEHGGERTPLEVVAVTPVSNAIVPHAETIVLVVPPSTDWMRQDFPNGVLQLIGHLSSPQDCPWLAKTVLIVSSSDTQTNTHQIVSEFVNSYLGGSSTQGAATPPPLVLPTWLTAGMIRNLLVLDVSVDDGAKPIENRVQVLPQGRHGLLPNMDLVFLAVTLLQRTSFLDPRRHQVRLDTHPWVDQSKKWQDWIEGKTTNQKWSSWAREMGDLALFMYTLAMGPYAPHAPALGRGVDALTIRVQFNGRPARSVSRQVTEVMQKLEGLIRALSNLHERLHHSITLYLLPSPTKFVSHSEYLIPNILLLVPMIVTAVRIVCFDAKGFDGSTLATTAPVVMFVGLAMQMASGFLGTAALNALLFLLYSSIPSLLRHWRERKPVTHRTIQSLQFLGCLAGIYIHAPLVLQHVSLALPSSLLFSLLLSIPWSKSAALLPRLAWGTVLVATWPPTVLLPLVFNSYTTYVNLAFTPLHIVLSIMWFSNFLD